jgi:hypothetical protein
MRFSALLAAIVLSTSAAAVLAQDVPPQDHPDQHKAKPAPRRAKQPLPPKHKAAPAPKPRHEEPKDPHQDHAEPRHD